MKLAIESNYKPPPRILENQDTSRSTYTIGMQSSQRRISQKVMNDINQNVAIDRTNFQSVVQ